MSVKNLAFLSSEQALADLAYFIEGMNTAHQMPNGTKWILFGGSYSGSLAAWMRFKYPHLVRGAMSASGPLLAEIDFQGIYIYEILQHVIVTDHFLQSVTFLIVEYFIVVEQSLKTHSQACVDAIAAANNQVHIMLRHRIGQQGLEKLFK